MNRTEYVEYAKQHQQEFEDAIAAFHPKFCNRYDNLPIESFSASGAEEACRIVRKQIRESDDKVRLPITDWSPDNIMKLANSVWFGMPDTASIRYHQSFSMICNLAEGWEDDEEDYLNA